LVMHKIGLFGLLSGGSGPIPSSLWCDVVVTFAGLRFHEPFVILLCLLAAAIGVSGFLREKNSLLYASRNYSLTFGLYGVMMTCAMFTDCLQETIPLKLWKAFSIANASLTSSISICFALCGLIDVGVIVADSFWSLFAQFMTIIVLIIAWTIAMVQASFNPTTHSTWLTRFLYTDVILIGCSAFGLCQCYRFYKHGFGGIGWYLLGAIVGFVGFLPVVSFDVVHFLCSYLGKSVSPYLGPEFVFFLMSDLSVLCLTQYYLKRDGKAISTSAVIVN